MFRNTNSSARNSRSRARNSVISTGPDTLSNVAFVVLFLVGLMVIGFGAYYIIIYKKSKGEMDRKIKVLGIVNIVVGSFSVLFPIGYTLFLAS